MITFVEHAINEASRGKAPRGDLPGVFVDMDGVLVNFHVGAETIIGRKLPAAGPGGPGTITNDEWKTIQDIDDFWETLPPEADFRQLWDFVKRFKPSILSAAPNKWPEAKVGKLKWLKRHVGKVPGTAYIVKRSSKKKFAKGFRGEPNLLIDDFDKNIKEWEAAGGIGILHRSAAKTIKRLKELGF
tara:strand:+ start:375 stop:932 length:558 start_codon:yes stop_codon:yes gene_type:complete